MADRSSTGELSGRIALVTGASRGIGREIALELARRQAAVALLARTHADVEQVAAEIRASGGSAIPLVADACDEHQITTVVAQVRRELGAIDILINNVGANALGPIAEMAPDEWWRLIEVNVKSVYVVTRAVIPHMIERRQGRIINL